MSAENKVTEEKEGRHFSSFSRRGGCEERRGNGLEASATLPFAGNGGNGSLVLL